MSQLDYSPTGLPEDFVVRGFLEQPDLEAGLRFLNTIEHATGQNYTVAEPGSRAIDLEVSSNKIVEWAPWEGADRVFHSNHALANDDIGMYQSVIDDNPQSSRLFPDYAASSIPRFEELSDRFGAPSLAPAIDDMKAAFSTHDRPLCRHPETDPVGPMLTLGCLIMELTEPPALHIAPGPPCVTPFRTYRF